MAWFHQVGDVQRFLASPHTQVNKQWVALFCLVQKMGGPNYHHPTTRTFVHDGQQVAAEYRNTQSYPDYHYMYGSYIDEPVMRTGVGGNRYYHRNQQYSIVAMTNGSGTVVERYAYDAYGTPTITNGTGTVLTATAQVNRYMYTGREWDGDLGLYHYRARMYNPNSGRFCSRDPIGFKGSPWNLYEFLDSTPFGSVDPLGHQGASVGGGATNQEIRDVCDEYLDRSDNLGTDGDGNIWPEDQEWPDSMIGDCDRDIKNLFRSRATPMHRRLRRLKGSLVAKGCTVEIGCECCERKDSGAQFLGSGNNTGNIGRIKMCANNLNGDYLQYLVHEMTHAAQTCHGVDNSNESCIGRMKAEIEAYHCQGACDNARDCIREAARSSCGYQYGASACLGFSDATIDRLISWYDQNSSVFCTFPSTRFDPQGSF